MDEGAGMIFFCDSNWGFGLGFCSAVEVLSSYRVLKQPYEFNVSVVSQFEDQTQI